LALVADALDVGLNEPFTDGADRLIIAKEYVLLKWDLEKCARRRLVIDEGRAQRDKGIQIRRKLDNQPFKHFRYFSALLKKMRSPDRDFRCLTAEPQLR
jgi:hypothetical protein